MTSRSARYTLRTGNPAKTRAEAVVVGVLQAEKGLEAAPGSEEVRDAFKRRFRGLLAQLGVTGRTGEVTRVPAGGVIASPLLVLVGLGKEATPESVRQAAGAAARAVPNATSVALSLPADSPELVRAAVEGHRLGAYEFTTYKKASGDRSPSDVVVLSPVARRKEVVEAFEAAQVVADAVATTRDWVNLPPGDLTPPLFAETVAEAAAAVEGVTATVYDEAQLAELGCGGIIAVGMGSAAPPRLVELAYTPAEAVAHLALVGKGITFDSGGLTLKPGNSMKAMKSDMAGAAAVVQATLAIARLGLPVRISAYAPMAENMVSGSALRPGDVVVHYGGTTTEVQNTDAEGRLILADALARAVEVAPDAIVDVATLTGHMVTALGDRITGVMGSDGLVEDILDAASTAGEEMWPMPIPEAIVERLHKSSIADLLQHDWIRWGGGLYAAAFLREFTGELPWAHLDIAGPSFNSGGAYGHVTSGGTGVAVTTLVDYVRGLTTRRVGATAHV